MGREPYNYCEGTVTDKPILCAPPGCIRGQLYEKDGLLFVVLESGEVIWGEEALKALGYEPGDPDEDAETCE